MMSSTSAEIALTADHPADEDGSLRRSRDDRLVHRHAVHGPLLMVIVYRKFDRPFAMTTAGTDVGARLSFNPRRSDSCESWLS